MGDTTKQKAKPLAPVYVLLLTGEEAAVENFVARRFPGRKCILLSKLQLRTGGWRGQIKAFRKLRGEALVFFARNWAEFVEPQLMVCSSVFHSCRFTILADSTGRTAVYGRFRQLCLFPP